MCKNSSSLFKCVLHHCNLQKKVDDKQDNRPALTRLGFLPGDNKWTSLLIYYNTDTCVDRSKRQTGKVWMNALNELALLLGLRLVNRAGGLSLFPSCSHFATGFLYLNLFNYSHSATRNTQPLWPDRPHVSWVDISSSKFFSFNCFSNWNM